MNFRRCAAAFCAAAFSLSLSACNGGGASSPAPVVPANYVEAYVHQKVKHVFVIVQENHTFDNYFGLYPGQGQTVENLGSATAQADDCVPDPEAGACQRPFLISSNPSSPSYVQDAPDTGGGSNSRYGQQYAIDHGKMDGFLTENEGASATPLPAAPTETEVANHNAALAIEGIYDCDTVPYLWYYAKNFTLFDHYFQANTGQSTPGNVQLFAGQMGQTEAASGNAPLVSHLSGTGYTDGVPLGNDNNPPQSQIAGIGPYVASAAPDPNQAVSFASMPVLLNPAQDQSALNSGIVGLISADFSLEAKSGRSSVGWGWYEEGLLYPSDGTNPNTWSQHHTSPLYFDYINHANSTFAANLHDNTPSNGIVSDIRAGKLPASGVFWIKGGNYSSWGFKPADPILASHNLFTGDDDHPGSGDSDHTAAEAYVATIINAIAQSSYWKDSVIILTWDDSGGFYDHYPPAKYGATCPDDVTGLFAGTACGDGLRLPMLIISPFAKTGVVVHDQSDAGSVSKFIEAAFGLPTFASLPNEAAGVRAGLAPADANALVSDLTGALDVNKLSGSAAPLPPGLAEIPSPSSQPTMNCKSLGMTPIASPASVPAGFQTSGYYEHQAITNASTIHLPKPPDDGD